MLNGHHPPPNSLPPHPRHPTLFYWVGQKFHSGFSVTPHEKYKETFWPTQYLNSGHPNVGQDILLQYQTSPLWVKSGKDTRPMTAVLQPLDGARGVNMITWCLPGACSLAFSSATYDSWVISLNQWFKLE